MLNLVDQKAQDSFLNYTALSKVLITGKFTKGFTIKYRSPLPYYSFWGKRKRTFIQNESVSTAVETETRVMFRRFQKSKIAINFKDIRYFSVSYLRFLIGRFNNTSFFNFNHQGSYLSVRKFGKFVPLKATYRNFIIPDLGTQLYTGKRTRFRSGKKVYGFKRKFLMKHGIFYSNTLPNYSQIDWGLVGRLGSFYKASNIVLDYKLDYKLNPILKGIKLLRIFSKNQLQQYYRSKSSNLLLRNVSSVGSYLIYQNKNVFKPYVFINRILSPYLYSNFLKFKGFFKLNQTTEYFLRSTNPKFFLFLQILNFFWLNQSVLPSSNGAGVDQKKFNRKARNLMLFNSSKFINLLNTSRFWSTSHNIHPSFYFKFDKVYRLWVKGSGTHINLLDILQSSRLDIPRKKHYLSCGLTSNFPTIAILSYTYSIVMESIHLRQYYLPRKRPFLLKDLFFNTWWVDFLPPKLPCALSQDILLQPRRFFNHHILYRWRNFFRRRHYFFTTLLVDDLKWFHTTKRFTKLPNKASKKSGFTQLSLIWGSTKYFSSFRKYRYHLRLISKLEKRFNLLYRLRKRFWFRKVFLPKYVKVRIRR